MPKITVITPVYNGEKYIRSAIDSLLAQTCQDWELLVVDDGSTDSTPQILQTFTDSRIKVIRQPNGGEANARNTGLKNATGQYIAFLDADDAYLPNALEDLSKFLDTYPRYDVVFSDGQICDENDRLVMSLTDVRSGIHTGKILDHVVISSSVVTVPVCTLTRRQKVMDHGVQFDQNVIIGPDWDFWIQLAVHVEFGYLDKLTCKYRIHTTNISRTTASEKRKNDELYRRTKIMNAAWFTDLSLPTRELFFLDLLTNTLAGDPARQQHILQSPQFAQLSPTRQGDLWRMVGIDALKSGCDSQQVMTCLQMSLEHNPADRKTRIVLGSLKYGRGVALLLVNLWYGILDARKKVMSLRDPHPERLQKLLGLK